MLVFGIDVPLVEILFALAILIFLILAEVIVILALMIKKMNRMKELEDEEREVLKGSRR